jgi:hypothetical protein
VRTNGSDKGELGRGHVERSGLHVVYSTAFLPVFQGFA